MAKTVIERVHPRLLSSSWWWLVVVVVESYYRLEID